MAIDKLSIWVNLKPIHSSLKSLLVCVDHQCSFCHVLCFSPVLNKKEAEQLSHLGAILGNEMGLQDEVKEE